MRAKRKNVRELTERRCPNEERARGCLSYGGEFRIIGADGAHRFMEPFNRAVAVEIELLVQSIKFRNLSI